MWPWAYDNTRAPKDNPKAKRYPPPPLIENTTVVDADVTPEDQEQLTTQYTERAVDFIRRDKGRPGPGVRPAGRLTDSDVRLTW